jgi:DNA-directed RNA polymerase subunit RPC12/RpoP
MNKQNEVTCPSCGTKLRLKFTPSWTTGSIRCPACKSRVTVTFNKDNANKTNFKKIS